MFWLYGRQWIELRRRVDGQERMKKWLLILVVGLLIAAYFVFDLDRQLTLEGLKSSLNGFYEVRDSSPVMVGAAFFAFYVLVTAVSLPGAAVMTLAAGALFGLLWGTLLVSFASSLGALLAFLVSRYLLRDLVQRRYGDRLKTVNEGVRRDGAFYLFTLRLIPIIPSFLINLVMGLTPMPALIFYAVSQIGMLAGTLVYVNAGTQLAQVSSLSGILSADVLLSFALLAVFPWLARFIVGIWKRRSVYARWQRPGRFDRNLVVIGAGAAGLVSAYIAAAVKARVTLIESHKMGGDCLNYGCVPSKALIKSARLAHQIRHADRYGLAVGEPRFSFRQVMARVHEVIRTVAPHDSIERYTDLGVEVLQGYARIVDPWTVEIACKDGRKQRLTTRSIIIATGSRPFIPPLPGLEDIDYLTSDTLWESLAGSDTPPERLVILGGGPIGTELAQAFARLGSKVIQIEMAPRLLSREDEDASAMAQKALEADGVTVLTGHRALSCERKGDEKYITVEHAGETRSIAFDVLICAVGRAPRLSGFGLEELGIPAEKTVDTNEYLETLYPNIYAAGDVAGPYQFTHTAGHQAWYATVNALFGDFKKFKVDYRVIPWTTFIDPEIARVGLNEQEAGEKNIDYELTRYGIDDLDRAITDSVAYGFIKVLTVPGKDRILGVTIVAEHAGDLMAECILAMKWGLGLNKILSTIHTYPTLAEANKYAAGEWKRRHTPVRVLAWLERLHAWRRGHEDMQAPRKQAGYRRRVNHDEGAD